jgi:hypothetical protein
MAFEVIRAIWRGFFSLYHRLRGYNRMYLGIDASRDVINKSTVQGAGAGTQKAHQWTAAAEQQRAEEPKARGAEVKRWQNMT